MRRHYKMLWFEDESRWLKGFLPKIKKFLLESGFILYYDHFQNVKDLDSLADKINDYDLICVDYTLKGGTGDRLIENIRKSELYTEIVFYSQNGEESVREIMKDLRVDGIYCAGERGEEFEDKIKNIINTTIKKVQDLTNLRGLVMAETSELDVKMEEIIEALFNKPFGLVTDEDKTVIKEKSLKSLKDMISTLEKLDEKNNLTELLKKLDHRGRWRTVKRLCKKNGEFKDLMETLSLYDDEIIIKRNDLAHSCEAENEKKEKIIKGRNNTYTRENFTQIRKDLSKHTDNFDNIKEIIS